MNPRIRIEVCLTCLLLATPCFVAGAPAAVSSLSLPRIPLAGDWDGDGQREIGWYESSTGELFRCAAYDPGGGLEPFEHCVPSTLSPSMEGWTAFTLDWDGGPSDELAIYDPKSGKVFLLHFTERGVQPQLLLHGLPKQIPLAGDWTGDGLESVAFYDGASLRLSVLENLDDAVYQERVFGPPCIADPELFPLATDRNGDGVDTVGLHINGIGVFLSDSDQYNLVDERFLLNWDARVVAGSWDGDHVLVYDPASHMVLVVTEFERSDEASGIPQSWPPDPEDPVEGCDGSNNQ